MADTVDEPGWRDRIQAGRPRGVPLDPGVEQVEGVDPYPTTYAADHVLLTEGARLLEILEILRSAGAYFGWGVRVESIRGDRQTDAEAEERARVAEEELGLPCKWVNGTSTGLQT